MIPFTDLLDRYQIPHGSEGNQHCRPGWINFDCPFCGTVGKWHMGYNIRSRYVHCWACGHHRLGETLSALAGIPLREAMLLLDEVEKDDAPTPKPAVAGRLELPPGLGPLESPHINYLRKVRGFTDVNELVRLWGLQGIGLMGGPLKWRIFIPIYDGGKVVSWTTRSISHAAEVRYSTAKPSQEVKSHKEVLYGAEHAGASITVHEGPIDVWTVGPGAVATLGLTYSKAQVALMARYPVRAICFDNEPAAQRRADQLCSELEAFPGETYNVKLSGKDAASSPKREVRQLRERFLLTAG